jgi:hypothetical protein
MTTSEPSRANVRLLVRMPLAVAIGKRTCPVLSEAIWSSGLVVRCDVPVSPRQLVKLQVPVPPDGALVTLNAMVEAVRPAATGVTPALTLSLYGNGGAPLERWSGLLGEIRARFPDATSHLVVSETVTEQTPDAVHRRSVRFLASFEVRVPTLDELATLVTRDLSRGGMFLRTRRVCAVGDELQVELLHPTTHDAFALRCVVRRRVNDGDASGLGVEFVGLDPARRQALRDFASSGLPDDEDLDVDVDVDLIDEE